VSILDTIVETRRREVRKKGHTLGEKVPNRRTVGLVPFGREPFLICEIKRRSPSRGEIASTLSAVEQARSYIRHGVKTVSVLTERNYFAGSLTDLIQVKRAFPHTCVLRKDFIVDEEDIDVSFRAGADAVLLIARILDTEMLKKLYDRAVGYSMAVLFEIHDEEDIDKAWIVRPAFTGINSRNLEDFSIDRESPEKLLKKIGWDTAVVFESGIKEASDVRRVTSAGFSGILVGETVMRNPGLIDMLSVPFYRHTGEFWRRLFLRKRLKRPLVKVCGITKRSDAECALGWGADMLGFVFAPSPRRAAMTLLKEVSDICALKVGVVVTRNGIIEEELTELLDGGALDVLQFHGIEDPDTCMKTVYPWYRALRIRDADDIAQIDSYNCPRVLVDGYDPDRAGGTGRRIPYRLVEQLGERYPIWLAGGIGPGNVREIVERFRPELIDASSGLESEPGKKDTRKVRKFFREIEDASHIQ
jgi:indole-3-glycerol phosphate synthase/phosphoribosylanthranilate isomerase